MANAAEKLNNFYRYNWPYDFFSLIELAKVEETVKLVPQTGLKLFMSHKPPEPPLLPDILEEIPEPPPSFDVVDQTDTEGIGNISFD